MSVKNLMEREGDWTCIKEVLGWTIDTEAGTVALLERKLWELLVFVVPVTQRRMGWKELECLVVKTHSMHLAVPRTVLHLYHLQRALSQGGA